MILRGKLAVSFREGSSYRWIRMGVEPKIGGKNPKWMVKIMKNPMKIDDLGVPLFLETSISVHVLSSTKLAATQGYLYKLPSCTTPLLFHHWNDGVERVPSNHSQFLLNVLQLIVIPTSKKQSRELLTKVPFHKRFCWCPIQIYNCLIADGQSY